RRCAVPVVGAVAVSAWGASNASQMMQGLPARAGGQPSAGLALALPDKSTIEVLASIVSAAASVSTAAAMAYMAVKLTTGAGAQQRKTGDRPPSLASSPKLK
ncbi:unnamed protein product, partial [Polarella glacialis]